MSVGGVPAIVTKRAETKVVLFDGQTTVIGGLNKEKINNTDYGVPLLKDIPILGYFFKGIDKKNELEDILIFITPYILKEHVAEATQESPAETMVPPGQPPEPGALPEEKMVPQGQPPESGVLPGEKVIPRSRPSETGALPREKVVPQSQPPEPGVLPGEKMVPQGQPSEPETLPGEKVAPKELPYESEDLPEEDLAPPDQLSELEAEPEKI